MPNETGQVADFAAMFPRRDAAPKAAHVGARMGLAESTADSGNARASMSRPDAATILALDPGTTHTGWCEYGGHGGVIESGVMPNGEVLEMLKGAYRPDYACLAIEMIASYGMPVGREVFETCVWIGRFIQVWGDEAPCHLVYRRDVKQHLCNSTKAKDANVWQALVDKFGGSAAVGKKASPGPLYGVKSHARAALAVAVTVSEVA